MDKSEGRERRRRSKKNKPIRKTRHSSSPSRSGRTYVSSKNYRFPDYKCRLCDYEDYRKPLGGPSRCKHRTRHIKYNRFYWLRRFDLNKKLRRQSFPVTRFSSQERKYKCSFCKLVSSSWSRMQRHQNNSHFLQIVQLRQFVQEERACQTEKRIAIIEFLPNPQKKDYYMFYKCKLCNYTNSSFTATSKHLKELCNHTGLNNTSQENVQNAAVQASSNNYLYISTVTSNANQNQAKEYRMNRFGVQNRNDKKRKLLDGVGYQGRNQGEQGYESLEEGEIVDSPESFHVDNLFMNRQYEYINNQSVYSRDSNGSKLDNNGKLQEQYNFMNSSRSEAGRYSVYQPSLSPQLFRDWPDQQQKQNLPSIQNIINNIHPCYSKKKQDPSISPLLTLGQEHYICGNYSANLTTFNSIANVGDLKQSDRGEMKLSSNGSQEMAIRSNENVSEEGKDKISSVSQVLINY